MLIGRLYHQPFFAKLQSEVGMYNCMYMICSYFLCRNDIFSNAKPEAKLAFACNMRSYQLRCSTCPLVFGRWELSHVIFLKLRKKELLAKLSKFTK